MANYNKVILMGNLTRDCETRFAANGTAIVKFALAVNRRYQDAEGNWKEQPTFIDITMFGKRGEAFARFHTKGKPAFIEGQLRLDNWDDKQTGQKRSKLYVVGDNWEFVSSGGGSREASGGGSSYSGGPAAEGSQEGSSPEALEPAGGGAGGGGGTDETPF